MIRKCKSCGTKLHKMDNTGTYYCCPNCGKDYWLESDGNLYNEDDEEYQELYAEDEEDDLDDIPGSSLPPEGCRECGGDYPNCVDSCPLYDN